jgi:hypothetical protein
VIGIDKLTGRKGKKAEDGPNNVTRSSAHAQVQKVGRLDSNVNYDIDQFCLKRVHMLNAPSDDEHVGMVSALNPKMARVQHLLLRHLFDNQPLRNFRFPKPNETHAQFLMLKGSLFVSRDTIAEQPLCQ